MADQTERKFVPLYAEETEGAILARLRVWANEGLDPALDPDKWVDTREGAMWWVGVFGMVRELARIYQLMGTEVPMAAFVLWAWANYLDDHAEVRDLFRKQAVAATGLVEFTGPAGTLIADGTPVSVEPPAPDAEVAEFEVVAGDTIGGGGVLLLPVRARVAGVAGNVSADSITLLMSPILGVVVTVTNPDATHGGEEAETDEQLRKRVLDSFRLRAGGGTISDYMQWAGEFPGVGRVTVVALGRGPGTVVVIVSTADGGPVSDDVRIGLQNHLDPPAFTATLVSGFTLPVATIQVTGESGVARPAGLLRLGDQVVAYTAKVGDTFTGCTGGVGVFSAGAQVVQSGRGAGRAPVGHHVIVLSAAVLNVAVVAVVEHESGYSLAGGPGSSATREQIELAVDEYVRSVLPGGEVVRSQVSARIVTVEGVHDVSGLTINGVAGDLAVPADPPKSPVLTRPLTLT